MEVSGLDPLPGLCVAHLAACNNTLNEIIINRGIDKTEVKTQNGSPKDAAEGWDRKRIAKRMAKGSHYPFAILLRYVCDPWKERFVILY